MRAVVFRILAGLISLGFAALLVVADTTKTPTRDLWGMAAVAVGLGLYAVLGSDLGERLLVVAMGGRDPSPPPKA